MQRYGTILQSFSLASILTVTAYGQMRSALDAAAIGKAAGCEASVTSDKVVRLAWPRTDVTVTVDGVSLTAFAGLTSWAALTPCTCGAMMMGDTVVFDDEITPAIDAAFAGELQVTALHNHFVFDEPRVFFLHLAGDGDPLTLAGGQKRVWDAIKEVRRVRPTPAKRFDHRVPAGGTIDPREIEDILGDKVQTQDGVVKVTIGREGKKNQLTIGGSMGLTTWAAFSGTPELAVVDGDFILTADEVQPVLRGLRKADIHIVALHNHMTGEQPPFYFTHFWGKGSSRDLAKGIRLALDEQKKVATPGREP